MSTMGIPTVVNHCRYRSRLEAKWATFFTMLGWKYQYEPYDLNGWIPDFILIGKDRDTLVEVKPFSRKEEFREEINKIVKAITGIPHQQKEILLLGCSIFPCETKGKIGWIGLVDEDGCYCEHGWGEIGEVVLNHQFDGWGFISNEGNWTDRITGINSKHYGTVPYDEALHIWNEAGNLVQWKATQ